MQVVNRRVWVLGAGFSHPLGAPLLRGLFRQEPIHRAIHLYNEQKYPGLAQTLWNVQVVFNSGLGSRWDDAESFLSIVDAAHRSTDRSLQADLDAHLNQARFEAVDKGRSTNVDKRYLDPLHRAVRRALALECHRFLRWVSPTSDRWLPCQRWVRDLSPAQDTVLTFNYDLVPAYIRQQGESQVSIPKLQTLLPSEQPANDRIPVLNLHGSVNWTKVEPGPFVSAVSDDEFLQDPRHEICIAAPGETKAEQTHRDFKPLWDRAARALSVAETIIFVGYSFPDTDATAQAMILDAISANQNPEVMIHLVLGGPGIGDGYATRAKALLASCRTGGDHEGLYVIHQPMGAQDFLPRFQQLLRNSR